MELINSLDKLKYGEEGFKTEVNEASLRDSYKFAGFFKKTELRPVPNSKGLVEFLFDNKRTLVELCMLGGGQMSYYVVTPRQQLKGKSDVARPAPELLEVLKSFSDLN